MINNSTYLVTPPNIFIAPAGLSFTLVTRDPAWLEDAQEQIEEDFKGTTVVFYSAYESTDDANWGWLYQQGMISDFVIVDLNSASEFDIKIFLPLVRERKIFWITYDDTDVKLLSMLNLHSASTAEDIEEFLGLIRAGM
jgi:hypothetical protein